MPVLLIPNGQQLFVDNDGVPLQSGTVGMYVPGTLTQKDTWQDPDQSALNTNPILLDGAGRAIIWGAGDYRQIVKDALGNVIWDRETSAGTGQSIYWGGVSGGSPNAQTLTIPGFSFVDGATVQWVAFYSNTGPLSILANSDPPVSVFANSQSGASPLIGGEILAGNIVTMVADTTLGGFRLTSGTASIRNLNVLGTLSRTGILTVAPVGADLNDFDPPGVEDSSVLRLSATVPINWSGLNSPAVDGTYYTVDNYGTQTITLLANSPNSSPGNLFLMPVNYPLLPSTSIELHYDGASAGWRMIGGSLNNRVTLNADRTYFVSASGSDSNDGLSISTPFLTIQKAVDTISSLDFNGFAVTVQLADGTYTGGAIIAGRNVGQKNVDDFLIQGNLGTPANVIVSTTSADCFSVNDGAMCKLDGMELRTAIGGSCISAFNLSRVNFGALRFGACQVGHLNAQYEAIIYTTSNYSITGSAGGHYSASNNGYIRIDNSPTITITGTPTISIFAQGVLFGRIMAAGAVFSGATSGGVKYQVSTGGMIGSGSNINLFPGASPGTGTDFQTSPFGWYH